MTPPARPRIAVLDDYQAVALELADWSAIQRVAEVVVFTDHLDDLDAVVDRLADFDALAIMRERTPFPRGVLERLPRLKLICSTGRRNAALDMTAAEELGITVTGTSGGGQGALELTWALILATVRQLPTEIDNFRHGRWQSTVGTDLAGATLGVLGLGNIGGATARIGSAFGMQVIAWSPHLTEERASSHGARLVDKRTLFAESDVLSIQLVLSEETRGIVGAADLDQMKPTAFLVNTSRGPLVDEAALIEVLQRRAIAGAALDVFDEEPLPADHPLRTLDNVLGVGHVGFVTTNSYRAFYGQIVTELERWLKL